MDDTKKEEKHEATTNSMNYRYQCEACTNIAFYANSKLGSTPDVCQNCGTSINRVLEERFIALTEEEKDSLKALSH